MSNILRKFIALGLFFFVFLFTASPSFASTFYLSPGSANIPSGSVSYVTIGINTEGESVNGVSAYLSYPSDKLEVVSLSYGSAFSIYAEKTYGGGAIRVSSGSISGFAGRGTVATIGFRGKAQGAATVAFIGGSAATRTSDSSDSLKLGSSSGGTYTVGAPNPVVTTTVAPAPTTASGTADTITPLVIKNVKVSNLATNSATITWTTNAKSNSTVEYGLNKDEYILSQKDDNLLTDHKVVLSGKTLTPGAVMHFRVKSKEASGNEGLSSDSKFQLKGYTVSIQVIDENNNPIGETEVSLYPGSLKLKTNSSGEVIFYNVTPGKHLVLAAESKENREKSLEIDVKDSSQTQNFSLNIDTAKDSVSSIFIYIVILSLIFLILLIVLVIVKFLKKRKPEQQAQVQEPGPEPVKVS